MLMAKVSRARTGSDDQTRRQLIIGSALDDFAMHRQFDASKMSEDRLTNRIETSS